MQYDPSTWANIATAIAAWFALALSLLSLVISWKAFPLAEHQETRRRPLLVPYLSDGFVRFIPDTGARVYGFLLSVSNPSDSDNAVAEVDLRLTYKRAGELMAVKMRSDAALGAAFGNRSGQTLSTPARIDAHQTVLGWVFFRLDEAVVKDGTVEAYTVVLVDSHGVEASVEPMIVLEYGDQTEASLDLVGASQRA